MDYPFREPISELQFDKPLTKGCVIFARGSGFPYILGAEREKTLLMGKLFAGNGFDVYVLSGVFYSSGETPEIKTSGEYDTIRFYIPSVFPKQNSLINRILPYLATMFNSVKFIIGLTKQYDDVYLICGHTYVFVLLLYKIMSLLYGIPLILNIEEWYLAHKLKARREVINNFIYYSVAPRISHGCICISEFIRNKVGRMNRDAKIYKLPAITNFSRIASIPVPRRDVANNRATFVYCSGIGYREVIDLVLDAFVQVIDQDEYKCTLVLILHGDKNEIQKLEQNYYAFRHSISFLSDLPYPELIQWYKSATALLIPLRPTTQDEARFPHKIAEYTATAKPIITTWHGEIKVYFQDRENALIMKDYSKEALIEEMKFVIDHPQEASRIGQRGYSLGKEVFDSQKYTQGLGRFLKSLKVQSY